MARRCEFYFQVAKQYLMSVMFFLLYRQKDIDNIIDFYSPKRKTPTNFEGKLPKLRHR